ncbi:Ribonuclease H-like domain [Cinara cedri]|uniref:Ribonuclease H-like domain n=1 Tax=Cinara cedri TaxID=506608 RepID=A0A5E4NN21_9HEMI|nr:Ribonuclease H-like domain [Cinara cedri]
MSSELHEVSSDVIKIINNIRNKALNSRLFESFCEEMGSQYTHLLLHAEIRWLSKGKILRRLFALRDEIKLFFQQQNNLKFQELLFNDQLISKLAYLTDIFSLLNELNISMQGQLKDVFTVRDKIDAIKKILLRQTQLTEEDLQMFQHFDEHMKEKDVNQEMVAIVQQHIESLAESFANNENNKLNMSEKDSFINLSSDSKLKTKFLELSKYHFWLYVKNEYPLMSEKLEISKALLLTVTSLEPKLHDILQNMQKQMSH